MSCFVSRCRGWAGGAYIPSWRTAADEINIAIVKTIEYLKF